MLAGMATALSKGDQVHMMELFRAFSAKDAPGMADATLAFSGASQSCPDPLAFRNHVQVRASANLPAPGHLGY